MAFLLKPLTTAELLDKIFVLYRTHFRLMAGIMVWVAIWEIPCSILIRAPRILGIHSTEIFGALGLFGRYQITGALMAFFIVIGSAAVVFAASQLYREQLVTILGSYRAVWKQVFWPACLCAILAYLCFRLFSDPVLIAFSLLARVLVRTCFILFLPVAILEKPGFISTIGRTLQLARKRFGQLAIMILLALSVNWGLLQLSQVVSRTAIYALPFSRNFTWLWFGLTDAAAGLLSAPLLPIGLVLFYYNARVEKEGLDLHLMMDAVAAAQDPASESTAAG